MEVYKKNVFIGTKGRCTETYYDGIYSYDLIQHNAVFIKVGVNDYREVMDLWGADCEYLPKFMILKSEMPHYMVSPKKSGDWVVSDLRPMFSNLSNRKEKIDLTHLLFKISNNPEFNSLCI